MLSVRHLKRDGIVMQCGACLSPRTVFQLVDFSQIGDDASPSLDHTCTHRSPLAFNFSGAGPGNEISIFRLRKSVAYFREFQFVPLGIEFLSFGCSGKETVRGVRGSLGRYLVTRTGLRSLLWISCPTS
jgi:hypothetical protein